MLIKLYECFIPFIHKSRVFVPLTRIHVNTMEIPEHFYYFHIEKFDILYFPIFILFN